MNRFAKIISRNNSGLDLVPKFESGGRDSNPRIFGLQPKAVAAVPPPLELRII
jgi:hypothetical protein